MRKKEKTRVIWRHPRGRFEIQETEHYSLFDHCTYYTRECVFTPQDDARGLCSEVPTSGCSGGKTLGWRRRLSIAP